MTSELQSLADSAAGLDNVFMVTIVATLKDGSMVAVKSKSAAPWSGYGPADNEEPLAARLAKACK